MLDEPTNHLDLDALEWLEEHLRRRSGSLLVASHDRAFLDATVTRVWELRDRHLTAFRGDYGAYHRQRTERDARMVKDVETQAESIARERELVQRYRSHRKFNKMHEHEARLERLESGRRDAPRAGRRLAIPAAALGGRGPSRSGEIALRVDDLAVGYLPGRGAVDDDGSPATDRHLVARAPFLAAQRGERIGIVGPNGAGKTTLLRTIAGDLPPLDGAIVFGQCRPDRLPRPVARCGDPGHDRPGRPARGHSGDPRRGARLPRPVPLPGRGRLQGGSLAVRRRAVPPGAGAAGHHAGKPPAARRADQPPGHPGARGDRGVHGALAGDAARGVARPPSAGDRVREAVGGRRGVGGGVRWRIPGMASRRGRRLDGRRRAGDRGDSTARREPRTARLRPALPQAPDRRHRPVRPVRADQAHPQGRGRSGRSCPRTPTESRRRPWSRT